jgi:hypothetical protein
MGDIATVGINQVALADLSSQPTGEVLLGLRPKGQFVFTEEPVMDYRDRPLQNRFNFRGEFGHFQPTLDDLNSAVGQWCVDGGVDAEILATPHQGGAAASGGCFQFFGANGMGYDFEWIMSNDDRQMKHILEYSPQGYAAGKAIIDAADSNTPVTWTGTNYGIVTGQHRSPYIADLTAGAPHELARLLSYNLTLKSVGVKDLYNRTQCNYINAKLEFVTRKAKIADIVTQLGYDMSLAVTFQEYNLTTTYYDKFIFNAGVLMKTSETTIGDDERLLKLTYEGSFPLANMSIDTSESEGGDDADATKGGTCTISL